MKNSYKYIIFILFTIITCKSYAQMGTDSQGNYIQNKTIGNYNFGTVNKLRIGSNVTTSVSSGPVYVNNGSLTGKINNELHIFPVTHLWQVAITGRNNNVVLEHRGRWSGFHVDVPFQFTEPGKVPFTIYSTTHNITRPCLRLRSNGGKLNTIFPTHMILGYDYFGNAEQYPVYVSSIIHADDVFLVNSDARLKTNIKNIDFSTSEFTEIADYNTINVEKLKEVSPNLVNDNNDIDLIGLIPLIVETLKTQQAKIDSNNKIISNFVEFSEK